MYANNKTLINADIFSVHLRIFRRKSARNKKHLLRDDGKTSAACVQQNIFCNSSVAPY